MKKIVSLFLALTMLSLTACGGAQSAPPSGEEANAAEASVSAQPEQSAEQAASGADTQSPAQAPKGGSTLIVYFSESGNTETIASYRTMERRIKAIQANGTDAEIEVFQGLSHGFGLGTGTVAEGWIDRSAEFWERNTD